MSNNLKSLIFASLTAIVCSVLLTAASLGLKPKQMRNVELDKKKNILKAVGLIAENDSHGREWIENSYKENIRNLALDQNGIVIETGEEHPEKTLPVWLYMENDRVNAYVVPINTRGLWGKIYGYLALSRDGSTIIGFTVYKHSETPGLGGEIEKAWFQNNFKGKKITDSEGRFVSINVAKGSVKDDAPKEQKPNYVDGISGATLTGKFLTAGFEEILKYYEPMSVRFRKDGSFFSEKERPF